MIQRIGAACCIFFANHELLANRIDGVVLLRFPEAPTAFRRGVLRTLKDEQDHTRLYLRRMQECGVQFGELPVSGYFLARDFRHGIAIDYVAGLSLTFEQANLDFARHFARGFAAAGDGKPPGYWSGSIKMKIAHVAYGLKWFRRWKNPARMIGTPFAGSSSSTFAQKGQGHNSKRGGPAAAGFDSRFIAELEVHSQSKGRTPNVFIFNPFPEASIAQGKSFTPTKQQTLLANDLANLPQFLCAKVISYSCPTGRRLSF